MVSFPFLNVNVNHVAFHKINTFKILMGMYFHIFKAFLLNSLAEFIGWTKLKFIKLVPLMFWF